MTFEVLILLKISLSTWILLYRGRRLPRVLTYFEEFCCPVFRSSVLYIYIYIYIYIYDKDPGSNKEKNENKIPRRQRIGALKSWATGVDINIRIIFIDITFKQD